MLLAGRRLPLVRPDGPEAMRLETQPEATDAREQLDHPGHAVDRVRPPHARSVPDPGGRINLAGSRPSREGRRRGSARGSGAPARRPPGSPG